MIEFVQSVLALMVTLGILVTVHEFGHFAVARLCGVRVLRFCIGFGKPIFSWYGKAPVDAAPPSDQEIKTRTNEPFSGTEFAIAALPLGGYVKMLDEREGFVADDELHLAFNRKSVWQRIAITLAGPAANFILAIVAYWALFSVGVAGIAPIVGAPDSGSIAANIGIEKGQEVVLVDGEQTKTWTDVNMQLFSRIGDTGEITLTLRNVDSNDSVHKVTVDIQRWLSDEENPNPAAALGLGLNYPMIPATIGGIVEGGAAEVAGMIVGNEIISFNGESLRDWPQFVGLIQSHPNQQVALSVLRDESVIELLATPNSVERDGREVGFLGAQRNSIQLPDDMHRTVQYPFHLALLPALEKTWSMSVFTLDSVKKMLMGLISPKNLSGPITIARVANATAQSGLEDFVNFIALISISLGVINLLPIPILDGGHLVYYLVEVVTRRPVSERIQMMGVQMGMFVIVGVMILAIYNDLMRL